MNKNVLIALYILAVLGISAMARANSAPVITSATYHPQNFQLFISGKYFDACQNNLYSRIDSQSLNNNQNIVTLNLFSESTQAPCTFNPIEESKFDMVIDVRSLGLQAGQNYKINFSNKTLSDVKMLQISLPQDMIAIETDNTALVGLVVSMANSGYALVFEDQSFVVIKSAIDLSQYAGSLVRVSGFELNFNVGPALELNILDPLQDLSSKSDSTTFLVNSISLIPSNFR